ncbi:peptide chain release factor N(5)-glutamine methyltransferase [Bhargavaea beijingensis]|uniref:Release factor glutamine methyltransferase n=1 Tax=Bhargavaea beijingensis TaxID=426756 RepID=A0A1G7DU92_9BACL|nr:peptide chain release factor N(5)-glutamine methyltransferase [Bhargavaea beijingensis]MCW1928897.1 peptide chain release factor N(5)-glutamine methyltransferase [Bhargavaea beijingensis]RSK29976.1 peptide chain release factor N(5)-glutamine methyltransferase [Bhargavaea beijingensis]SDE55043.1 release factor glutamine methyltransferase [Bhargavaea beijingensis]
MQQSDTAAAILAEGKKRLAGTGREAHAAELLLMHVLDVSRTQLLIRLRDQVGEEERRHFFSGIDEMAAGVPLQYVTGREMFCGRPFTVTPDVLIPRPETEELVSVALSRAGRIWPGRDGLRMADIGTGSGAIAVTFKLERPGTEVTATDISPAALRVAKANADQLGAEVSFLEGDMAVPLSGEKWDIVLSNPPYINPADGSEMSETVTGHEPHQALFAEEKGLAHYRTLADSLPALMAVPGLIGVEIGHDQGPAVLGMLRAAFPHAAVEVVRDINGKDRMVFCEIPEKAYE